MNLQTKLFPWSVLLNIALAVALFFTIRANYDNSESHALDREVLIKGNAHLKSELKLRDSVVLAIQSDRASDSAEHAAKQGSLKTQINGLKWRLANSPEFEGIKTVRDTIILKQDTLITDLENQRDSLKLSYQEELKILGQSRLALEAAYDSTFNDLLSTNDKLIQAIQKVDQLTGKNKVLTWAAILEAVGIVILALLL